MYEFGTVCQNCYFTYFSKIFVRFASEYLLRSRISWETKDIAKWKYVLQSLQWKQNRVFISVQWVLKARADRDWGVSWIESYSNFNVFIALQNTDIIKELQVFGQLFFFKKEGLYDVLIG